jgi:hypothetical protein
MNSIADSLRQSMTTTWRSSFSLALANTSRPVTTLAARIAMSWSPGCEGDAVHRAETMNVATAIAEMPPFALTLAKQAVNQSEELMGLRAGVDAAFALHQLAHASNAERHGDYIAGMTPQAMRDAQR